jgi:hypothetical protein
MTTGRINQVSTVEARWARGGAGLAAGPPRPPSAPREARSGPAGGTATRLTSVQGVVFCYDASLPHDRRVGGGLCKQLCDPRASPSAP